MTNDKVKSMISFQQHICVSEERWEPSPNDCPGHDTNWWWGFSNAGVLGNVEYPFIAIAPKPTLAWCGSTWYGPIYGSNGTKLCNYAKLNYLKFTVFFI